MAQNNLHTQSAYPKSNYEDPSGQHEQILNIIFVKLYMDYDLEQDFFPQFIANRDMMIKMLNDLPIHGGEQDG